MSGLDVDELEMMSADERREALEDAGVDGRVIELIKVFYAEKVAGRES